jgi:hypothetical protein
MQTAEQSKPALQRVQEMSQNIALDEANAPVRKNRVIRAAEQKTRVHQAKKSGTIQDIKDKSIQGALYNCMDASSAVHRPDQWLVDRYNSFCYWTRGGFADVRSAIEPRDKYDLNYLSMDDLVAHWDLLSLEERFAITRILHSDLSGNAFRYNLKCCSLEAVLTMAALADITNMLSNGKDFVECNLRSPGGRYSRYSVGSRALCPNTCDRAYKKFLKGYNFELLEKLGYVAYTFVIHSDDPRLLAPESCEGREEWRRLVNGFFQSNNEVLGKLLWKRRLMDASVTGHETSVKTYGPEDAHPEYCHHTHAVVFFPKGSKKEHTSRLDRMVRTIERRGRCHVAIKRCYTGSYQAMHKADAIAGYMKYLFRAYHPVKVYAEEVDPGNLRWMNLRHKEVVRTLLELRSGEAGNRKKGARRMTQNRLPSKKDTVFNTLMLQKRKKRCRIQKACKKRKKAKLMTTINLNSESRKGFLDKSAELGINQAFAEGVLREVEIANEKTAQGEKAFLQEVREELSKMAEAAESPYTPEDIVRITSSREEFEKAAQEEAEAVWEGIKAELRKEGADDAFIQGLEKEAGFLSLVRNAPKVFSPTNIEAAGGFGKNLGKYWHHFGGNKSKATEKFVGRMDRIGAPEEFLRDTGDKLLHNSQILPEVKDVQRANYYRDLQLAQQRRASKLAPGDAVNRDSAKKINARAQQYMDSSKEQFRGGQRDYLQNQILGVEQRARAGDQAAIDSLKSMGQGDDRHYNVQQFLEQQTKLNPASAKRVAEADRLSNDVFGNTTQGLRDFGGDAAKGGGVAGVSGLAGHMRASTAARTGATTPAMRVNPVRSPDLEKAKSRAGWGATVGGAIGAPLGIPGMLGGAAIGGGVGALSGAVGTIPTLALGAAGAVGYGGYRAMKGMFGGGSGGAQAQQNLDITGAPVDRNRAVPMMSNHFAGTVGGALLAALIANRMGLEGPASWLVPILGGITGYNYFPDMMNRWKDPYGYGANSVNPMDAAYNRQYVQ